MITMGKPGKLRMAQLRTMFDFGAVCRYMYLENGDLLFNVVNEAATSAFPGLHRDTGGDLLGCVQTAFSPRSHGYLGGKGGRLEAAFGRHFF